MSDLDVVPAGDWRPDRLLPGWTELTAPARTVVGTSAAGRLAAAGRDDPQLSVVRPPRDPDRPVGVLVALHGYNDYFFATHLADLAAQAGWAFLALDARRAGRSWREPEVPHYQVDLREQADDLDRTVRLARVLHPGVPLVVHAHSTGGLVAALWAHAHRHAGGPDALVLDSPFLSVERSWITPLADQALPALARRAPLRVISSAPSQYAGRLLERWSFDTTLKRPEGVPVRAAWLRAVRAGQLRLARGLDVAAPVLVAHSARSGSDSEPGPELDVVDSVLDVTTIADLAPRIGAQVRVEVVPDAVHDLLLSLDAPRAQYLALVGEALDDARAAASARASRWGAPADRRAASGAEIPAGGGSSTGDSGASGSGTGGSGGDGSGTDEATADRGGTGRPVKPAPPWPSGGRRPAVIGHRGAAWVAPQNTLASFEVAARAGADAVELDLQLSADGVAVVVHDDTLEATTDGTGPVAAHTAAQLAALDAGGWFSAAFAGQGLPTFGQVLGLMAGHPRVGLLVELKDDWSDAQARTVTDAVLAAGLQSRTVLQGFSRSTVAALARVAPALPRGLLVEQASDDLVEVAVGLGVSCVNPSGLLLAEDPGLVTRLHDAGLAVMVWTLDEDEHWARAVHLSVDAIITDRPDRLAGWLAQAATTPGGGAEVADRLGPERSARA